MISESFEYFLKTQGPVHDQKLVERSYAESFRGRLPSSLIDFWIEHGWGSYAEGMLKVCDPAMFQGVLPLVLNDDKDFKPQQCCTFAFTAFGELFIWHTQHRVITINLLQYQASATKFFDETKKTNADAEISSYLVTFKKDRYDPHDSSNKRLYQRAVKSLGIPGLDECFGFVPARPMGGMRSLQDLKRVKAREHFAILAQLGTVQLMDFSSFPPKFVRHLG